MYALGVALVAVAASRMLDRPQILPYGLGAAVTVAVFGGTIATAVHRRSRPVRDLRAALMPHFKAADESAVAVTVGRRRSGVPTRVTVTYPPEWPDRDETTRAAVGDIVATRLGAPVTKTRWRPKQRQLLYTLDHHQAVNEVVLTGGPAPAPAPPPVTDADHLGPGLWAGVVTALRLPPETATEPPGARLTLTASLTDDTARIRIALPPAWLGTPGEREVLAHTVTSRVPGAWTAHYEQAGADPHVEFTRTPVPAPRPVLPTLVTWEPTGDPYKIHLGQTHDGPAIVDMKSGTPHIGIAGETGSGKSTTGYLALVHARIHGWLVTVIDPKQNSYVEAQGKSGVRYMTDTYACVWAIAEFFTSMMAAEKFNSRAMRGKQVDTRPVPRLLIIDEMPSFREYVAAWWKFIIKEKGFPPVLVWIQLALMQGRSSDHRLFVGTHQYALDVFGSTMARDQVGTKGVLGDTSDPSWIVAYGSSTPRLNFDDTIKGRGIISTKGRKPRTVRADGSIERVEEIQYAYLTPEEINAYLDAAPAAPAWFDRGEAAPWITPEDLDRADAAGAVKDYLSAQYAPAAPALTADSDTPLSLEKGVSASSEPRETVSDAPLSAPVSASADPERMAELVELLADEPAEEQRYTLPQACELGIVERAYGAARQALSKARTAGAPVPQGEKGPRGLIAYTIAELHGFFGVPEGWDEDQDV